MANNWKKISLLYKIPTMKKLLLLLSLLLATNAWAESKTLICKADEEAKNYPGLFFKINYDLELTNADIIFSNNEDFLPYSKDNEGNIAHEMFTVLSVSPTKLTFSFPEVLEFRLVVDRHEVVLIEMLRNDKIWEEAGPPGKCQIVRAKKTRI